MDWSLPRCRRVAAISYGYIGRSVSNVSSDSASRLPTFRRLAIVSHLVSESSFARTRSQVLVDEYRHMTTPTAISQIKIYRPNEDGDCPGRRLTHPWRRSIPVRPAPASSRLRPVSPLGTQEGTRGHTGSPEAGEREGQ